MKLILERWNQFVNEQIERKKIFVLVGPPSVGKSHWMKQTFGDPPDAYVINRDDIANSVADSIGWTYDDLFVPPPEGATEGDTDEKYGTVVKSPGYMTWQPLSYNKVLDANNRIHELFTKRVAGAQPSGQNIIVDMTNMNAGARARALQTIDGGDYEKVAVVFKFEGAEDIIKKIAAKRAAEERAEGRSKTIPPEVFDRMFKAFQEVSSEEDFDEVVSVDNREALRQLTSATQ